MLTYKNPEGERQPLQMLSLERPTYGAQLICTFLKSTHLSSFGHHSTLQALACHFEKRQAEHSVVCTSGKALSNRNHHCSQISQGIAE